MFDPFFTTKPEGQGTGLGLSTVHGFVKQSGGHIKIYSELGEGSTVRIYLPRSREDEDAPIEAGTAPVLGGSETILLVEDDEDVRMTTAEMLTEMGYRVLRAKDADSALVIIDSGAPIDLLFTDVVMPGSVRAPELARKAKQKIPHIAVLFTTGYAENATLHGGRLDGDINLITKPYARDELGRKLRQILHNETSTPRSSISYRSPYFTARQERHQPPVTRSERPAVRLTNWKPAKRGRPLLVPVGPRNVEFRIQHTARECSLLISSRR